MAEKPKLKYHIKTMYDPKTGGTLLRPIITDRSSMSLDQVVAYAINAGYVRGQFSDMRGVLNGFIEAIQQLGKDGYDVSLKNWLRVHGELTGSVGEDRTLGATNGFKVGITALQDLKRDIDEFSWTNVDKPDVVVKVDSILTPGGNLNEIKKNGKILLTGKNLQFVTALGDKMTVNYEGLASPIGISPTEADASHQLYDWPSALAEVEIGTILEFKLTSRGGVEGAVEQVKTVYAKLVAAA